MPPFGDPIVNICFVALSNLAGGLLETMGCEKGNPSPPQPVQSREEVE